MPDSVIKYAFLLMQVHWWLLEFYSIFPRWNTTSVGHSFWLQQALLLHSYLQHFLCSTGSESAKPILRFPWKQGIPCLVSPQLPSMKTQTGNSVCHWVRWSFAWNPQVLKFHTEGLGRKIYHGLCIMMSTLMRWQIVGPPYTAKEHLFPYCSTLWLILKKRTLFLCWVTRINEHTTYEMFEIAWRSEIVSKIKHLQKIFQ